MWERRRWGTCTWEPVADSAVPEEVVRRWNLYARNGITDNGEIPDLDDKARGRFRFAWYRFLFCV